MDRTQKKETYFPKELSAETRRKLEATVLDVFSNSDFHQANIRAVAKKAGVSFGTIYKYYGSKEGLLFAVIDGKLSELIERVMDHLKGIEDIKEKMRKAFWLQLDFYEKNPDFGRILFLTIPYKTWMADETFLQKKLFNVFLDVVRQGQQDGLLNPYVRAGVLIDFMYGLVHRCFTMWIYRGQKEGLADNTNVLFEMLWRSLSKPGQ